MPSTIIVRYELKPECLDDHLGLIAGVFEHLRATAPAGAHYSVYRSADGHQFTHVGSYDTDQARAAATENDAFAAFTADIATRCVTPPEGVPQQVVQSYDSR
jgi:quinol monooxygenase YgiN